MGGSRCNYAIGFSSNMLYAMFLVGCKNSTVKEMQLCSKYLVICNIKVCHIKEGIVLMLFIKN